MTPGLLEQPSRALGVLAWPSTFPSSCGGHAVGSEQLRRSISQGLQQRSGAVTRATTWDIYDTYPIPRELTTLPSSRQKFPGQLIPSKKKKTKQNNNPIHKIKKEENKVLKSVLQTAIESHLSSPWAAAGRPGDAHQAKSSAGSAVKRLCKPAESSSHPHKTLFKYVA